MALTNKLTSLRVSRNIQSFNYDSAKNIDGPGEVLYTNIVIPAGSLIGYFIRVNSGPANHSDWRIGFPSDPGAILTSGVSNIYNIDPANNIISTGEQVIVTIDHTIGGNVDVHLIYWQFN